MLPSNVLGNKITANGANLSINNSGGSIFIIGSNFRNDPTNPNIKPIPQADILSFFRVFRQASPSAMVQPDGPPQTVIDPDMWDDGSGTLQAVPNNDWTVQAVYITAVGTYSLAYGQEVFNTLAGARSALLGGSLFFDEFPQQKAMVPRGYIIVQEGSTDLSSPTQAEFYDASRFRLGDVSVSGGVAGINAPGGSDTNIQFNNAGVFGGTSNYSYDGSDVIIANSIGLAVDGHARYTTDNSGSFVDLSIPDVKFVRANSDTITFGANDIGTGTLPVFLIPGYADAAAPATSISWPAPRDGTIKNLYILQNISGSFNNSIDYVVIVEGIESSVVVTIDANVRLGSDLVNTINVNQGDSVAIHAEKPFPIGTSPGNIVATFLFEDKQ
jgi:hypothetical protein